MDGRRGRMVGIVTERDILRTCASRRGPLDRLPVSDAMSRDVLTALPGDSIEDTMQLMTERRLRHLPVVEHGELVGLVSIGDLVKRTTSNACSRTRLSEDVYSQLAAAGCVF